MKVRQNERYFTVVERKELWKTKENPGPGDYFKNDKKEKEEITKIK